MDHKLEFRRQFILTQIPLPPPAGWMCLQVDPYCLYTHPDLEVHQARAGARSLVLIGCLFDPDGPEKGNADIVKDLLMASAGVRELFASIKRYAGRYALLYQDEQDVVILHDALALREIYYVSGDNRIVCGSSRISSRNTRIQKSGRGLMSIFANSTKAIPATQDGIPDANGSAMKPISRV